jgi:pimeloyl-ACP methyl ester carboxylesterase
MSTIPVFTSPEGKSIVMQSYQAILDCWPVPYTEQMIQTSFGETCVIASGPAGAPAVVLVHALLAASASWYRNVEALSQNNRVFAVDVVGEGNKSHPVKPVRSLDDFLEWFTELIDGLGIDTFALAGNSYGGFTSAYYAMKLPERVKKLILIGPAATIYNMRPFYVHMFIPKAVYGFFPKLPGLERTMRGSVNWMHDGLPRDPHWGPFFLNAMIYGGLINQVFPRVYTKEEFAQIKCPVLLILGKNERIYNQLEAAIQAAKELIPGIQVEVIPNAHHVTAVSQPELVNELILRFLAQ